YLAGGETELRLGAVAAGRGVAEAVLGGGDVAGRVVDAGLLELVVGALPLRLVVGRLGRSGRGQRLARRVDVADAQVAGDDRAHDLAARHWVDDAAARVAGAACLAPRHRA